MNNSNTLMRSQIDQQLKSSLDYLYAGDAVDFVEALKLEIAAHPCLHHAFLTDLSAGKFNDTSAVLRDYAHQYSFYSEWFTRYLQGVINTLKDPAHVELLLHNMEEERGIPGSSKKEELPHVEIYRLFKTEVGVTEDYARQNPACTTASLWRELFLQKCSSDIEGVGIAAIGLATEGIISTIYPYIIDAIERHTQLSDDASLFFKLHVDCDDGHSEAMEKIIIDIAQNPATREAIRFGVFSSLNLRSAFWDAQYARATRLTT